jgi:hypothetical protein
LNITKMSTSGFIIYINTFTECCVFKMETICCRNAFNYEGKYYIKFTVCEKVVLVATVLDACLL